MRGLIKCIPWILSRYKKSRDQAMPQPLFLLKKSSSHWTPMNWKQMCTEKQAFPYERGEQLKNRTDVSLSTSLFCLCSILHVIRQVNCVKCVSSVSHSPSQTLIFCSPAAQRVASWRWMSVGWSRKCYLQFVDMQPTHLTGTLKCSLNSQKKMHRLFLYC